MSLAATMKKLRKQNGVTQEQFAKMIGVERSSVGKYETGTMPSMEVLQRIAAAFGVSIDFLLGRAEEDLLFSLDNVFPLKTKKVPFLGEIACGEPIFADEEHGAFIFAPDKTDADFCLRAKGDSMIGARILDGDIVFIKKQPQVDNGQIAAVLIGDEATLKRVYYYPEKEKLMLSPENPAYEPLMFVGQELEEVRILGRAVAFQSPVK